jgi:hypothetical protein
MNNEHTKTWTPASLVGFGMTLAGGYVPGMVNVSGDAKGQWTTQTTLRTADAMGHGYNPGI